MVKNAIDELTKVFYGAFTSDSGAAPNVGALYGVFLPDALIVKNVAGMTQVLDLTGFVEPRRRLLQSGTFDRFEEHEVSDTTLVFQNIAQRFSSYEKTWSEKGVQNHGQGTKSLQFVLTSSGWKIASLIWDDV